MGKGGSQSQPAQPTQQTVTQTNLPEYARPYYERLMKRTEAESLQPYIPYEGPRVFGFTPDQGTAHDLVRGVANHNYAGLDSAQTTYGNASNYQSGYAPGTFSSQSFQGGIFDSPTAAQYMNPYIDNVLNRTRARALQLYNNQQLDRNSAAVKQGAFGGSRAAIVDMLAQRELNNQLADIDAKGLGEAFNTAGSLFNQDRSARLSAEQMTDDSRFRADQATDAARRAQEQYMQSGYGIGMQGAAGLGSIEDMRQRLGLTGADALSRVGTLQQQLGQASFDTAYQDFSNQRDYPRQQLQFLSGILRGVPTQVSSDVTTYAPSPSPYSQALGLGVAGLGLYNELNRTSGATT